MHRHLAIAAVFILLFGATILVGTAADDSKPEAGKSPMLLGHNIFFSLKEPTDENKAKVIEACKARLSQHPGIVFFAVGTRDENINGTFNDKDYDVALHMFFTGREALGTYARTADHQKFIGEATPLIKNFRIFDSSIQPVENQTASAK